MLYSKLAATIARSGAALGELKSHERTVRSCRNLPGEHAVFSTTDARGRRPHFGPHASPCHKPRSQPFLWKLRAHAFRIITAPDLTDLFLFHWNGSESWPSGAGRPLTPGVPTPRRAYPMRLSFFLFLFMYRFPLGFVEAIGLTFAPMLAHILSAVSWLPTHTQAWWLRNV